MAFELTTFGPGAKSGASVFFGPTQKLLQLSLAVCEEVFFDMSSWSSCKTSQQLGHVQGLKRCLASRCSPTDNEAIFPGFDSVTAREAVPGRHLKTAWHLASFWGPAIPCEALRNRQGKEAACESSDGQVVTGADIFDGASDSQWTGVYSGAKRFEHQCVRLSA